MRHIVLASIFLGLGVPAVHGRQTLEFDLSRLSEKGRYAYSVLQTATIFRTGSVGWSGQTSPEELALQNLMYESNGIEALRSLCRKATLAGSMYAFLGLRTRDFNTFQEEVRLYREMSEQIAKSSQPPQSEQIQRSSPPFPSMEFGTGTVLTQDGCVVGTQQVESILRKIELESYAGAFGKIKLRESNPPK